MGLHQKIAVAVAGVLIAVGVYVDAVLLADAEPKPGPTVDGIASERAAGKRTLQRNFEQIEKAIPELERSAEAFANRCDEGQQNYKVDEGFKYKCIYKITKIYGLDVDPQTPLVQIDRTLERVGWKSSIQDNNLLGEKPKELLSIYVSWSSKSRYPELNIGDSIPGDSSDFPEHEMSKSIEVQSEAARVLLHHRYTLGIEIEVVYYLKN